MPSFWIAAFDLAASLIAVALYAWDKTAAKRRARRISEKTLHVVALLGGWPGAWLGQRLFRHKTQKPSFRRVFWMTVVLNVVSTSLLLKLWRR